MRDHLNPWRPVVAGGAHLIEAPLHSHNLQPRKEALEDAERTRDAQTVVSEGSAPFREGSERGLIGCGFFAR